MEKETTQFFTRDYFKTSYNKEDVTRMPIFKKWLYIQEQEGKKVVRCPHCWGYELYLVPTNIVV